MDDKYLIVILVLAILFGASRLPSLGRNLGQGIRELKQGLAEGSREDVTAPDGGDQDTPDRPGPDGELARGAQRGSEPPQRPTAA